MHLQFQKGANGLPVQIKALSSILPGLTNAKQRKGKTPSDKRYNELQVARDLGDFYGPPEGIHIGGAELEKEIYTVV
jgi:hypothetical protein